MITMLRTLLVITLVACASSKNNPDAGSGSNDSTVIVIDAFGGPSFGEQCTTSAECQNGGYCVDGLNSDLCTYGCDQGCPDGWNCRVTDVGGDFVSLCMPQKFDFCKPCSADTECNGGVCALLDGVGYCLPDCPFEGTCPNGYSCSPDPTNAHPGNYCVPDTGSCTCTAEEAGQVRTCQTMNGAGTCSGLETCMPDNGGWSGCTAGTAGAEICDGLDNDCDQLIDDGVSGSACPITNSAGTCPGVQLCTGSSLLCQGQTPMTETCNFADDDCDGKNDETWPTLTTNCSDGIGGCARFGVIRCNSAATGTECSVVAGNPMTEICNGIDDDCNGTPDNGIPNLGNTCNVGQGACARQGNIVCASDGTTECSVTAGTAVTESCNGIDDNCDGTADETFKSGGIYNQNTHCGSCATDCTTIYALPNASGVCTVNMSTASCSMQCAPGAFDVDAATTNGCELILDPTAIYVSTNDTNALDNAGCGLGPVGTGAGNYPCLTIAQGLVRASITGRPRVRVANGIYAEAVTLANGKNLLGGHAPDNWQRNVSGTGTLITGVATIASTNHDYSVNATGINTATLFEGFVVVGGVNTKQSGNSYAVYVASSNNALSIANNVIYGGRGGPGNGGSSGVAGALGVNGTGRAANPAAYDAFIALGTGACNASNNRAYANGAAQSCGATNVSGGNGGGNRCPPAVGAGQYPPPMTNAGTEFSGIDGFTGIGAVPGAGADAGNDAYLIKNGAGRTCYIPITFGAEEPIPTYGMDGSAGGRGGNGNSGGGCGATTGSVVGSHWVGGSGFNGAIGTPGAGGGGGGAGGGSHCDTNGNTACAGGKDNLGGHGGGGGSGGCGGTGGGAATGGGGAFAIFITGGATAPVVTGNSVTRGDGGRGGSGGNGANGGPGGLGADGGTSAVFCADAAGRGGNGGDGGHGAGGGGGCGGGSFGIFTSGVGTPNYCMTAASNTISSGSGGAGGAGGYSLINTGGTGASGVLATCQFN